MTQGSPELTDAEWSIMKVLWQKGPCSARRVERELKRTRRWAYSTVNTMLRRLENKKVVSANQVGRTTFYKPCVTEKRANRMEIKQLCSKLFAGSTKPLMKFLLEDERLSEQDIRKIQGLIDKSKKR